MGSASNQGVRPTVVALDGHSQLSASETSIQSLTQKLIQFFLTASKNPTARILHYPADLTAPLLTGRANFS